jgi:hypothetical protein
MAPKKQTAKSGAKEGASIAEAEQEKTTTNEEKKNDSKPDPKRKKEGEQEQKQADKEQAQDDKKVAEKPKNEDHKGNGKSSGAHGDKEAEQEDGEGDEEQHAKKQKTAHHSEQPEHPGTHRKSVADVAKLHEEQGIERPKAKERLELLKKMQTLEDMKELLKQAKSEKEYKVGDTIEVDDLMQTSYSYELTEPIGKNFKEGFEPALSPKEMLEHGVFEGKIINDTIFEFPREWFEGAVEKGKLSPSGPNGDLNHFKIVSRLSLNEWHKKKWTPKHDPRGWFLWYCRYYLGRRTEEDDHQISRWRQLRRHAGQIKAHCEPGDLSCRPKQRQALLNWGHDAFI